MSNLPEEMVEAAAQSLNRYSERPPKVAARHALISAGVCELVEERDRLRNGVPDPESVRYGIEAEPWEGNGPCMDCEGRLCLEEAQITVGMMAALQPQEVDHG